jgi:hypothetical protein
MTVKVILSPGEKLEIEFADSDGKIEIDFKAANETDEGHILITADMPDSTGREGEIYKEVFGNPADFDEIAAKVA